MHGKGIGWGKVAPGGVCQPDGGTGGPTPRVCDTQRKYRNGSTGFHLELALPAARRAEP